MLRCHIERSLRSLRCELYSCVCCVRVDVSKKIGQVCAKVLPSVMPCLIDPGSHAVREAGFACVETYLGKLQEVSERMKEEEDQRRRVEVTININMC